MIRSLDLTLEKLLQTGLAPGLVDQVSISFATPDQDFQPPEHKKAINLFLYDIRENRELRDTEWRVERTDGSVTREAPPVRVDCSYMVTAWLSSPHPKDEHYLLGEVMQVLLRYPSLPAEVLQGGLKGQDPPLPSLTLHSGRLQSPGEFWQALGGKPKAAFHYTVTIGVGVHAPFEAGRPVTDKGFRFGRLEMEGT